jgi:ATP-independent RNA helicase DbpA
LATPREAFKIEAIEAFTGVTIERKKGRADLAPKDRRAEPSGHDAAMVTLVIGGGRKDKLRPGDILGALTGEAGGLEAAAVGKIEIHDRHTFVAVAKAVAATALRCLQEGRIKGRKFSVEPAR